MNNNNNLGYCNVTENNWNLTCNNGYFASNNKGINNLGPNIQEEIYFTLTFIMDMDL
jgi:hypothetical protein